MATMEGSSVAPAPAGPPPAPGEHMSATSKLVNAGTSLLSGFKPLHKICQHVCAFHCYASDASRQVRAHHFCSHVNEDMRQCLIYDSGEKDARLIGVEYIIAQHLYEQLPEDEKMYWHSHAYEVTSGQLVAHNVPTAAEMPEMRKLVGTYGKTWHFWQVDRGDTLPLGPPQLMMSFTADGQLDPQLLAARDKDMGSNTEEKRKARASLIPEDGLPTHPAADRPWRSNKAFEVRLVETDRPYRPEGMPGIEQIRGVKGA